MTVSKEGSESTGASFETQTSSAPQDEVEQCGNMSPWAGLGTTKRQSSEDTATWQRTSFSFSPATASARRSCARSRRSWAGSASAGVGFETETDLVGGSAYDAHGAAISEDAMERAQGADAVLFGAVGGAKWDSGALCGAPRGGPPAPAQGSRPVRQSAPGDLLSGARRCLLAQARGGGRPRHHDRARAHRRRLFRRAEGDRDARGRLPARGRHAALPHARSRAHRPRRLRLGQASAATRSPRRRSST